MPTNKPLSKRLVAKLSESSDVNYLAGRWGNDVVNGSY